MRHTTLLSILLLGLCAGATPIQPSPCTIGDACLSDRLWVNDPAGNQVYGKSVQEDREVPNAIYFIDEDGLVDPRMYGKPLVLLEPPDFTQVSDAVGVVFVGGKYYLAFKSDGGAGYPVTYGTGKPTFVHEMDAPVDVTVFLEPALRAEGYEAFFRSDTAEPPPVAESATILLFGGGLLLLAAMRRFAIL